MMTKAWKQVSMVTQNSQRRLSGRQQTLRLRQKRTHSLSKMTRKGRQMRRKQKVDSKLIWSANYEQWRKSSLNQRQDRDLQEWGQGRSEWEEKQDWEQEKQDWEQEQEQQGWEQEQEQQGWEQGQLE